MKIGQFLSNYLRVQDLKQPVAATIASVTAEEFGREGEKKEKKLVVYFKEFDQGLVISKTVINQIAALAESEETDDWIGKEVELFADLSVMYAGKRVGGIRVRQVSPTEAGGKKKK